MTYTRTFTSKSIVDQEPYLSLIIKVKNLKTDSKNLKS